MSLRRSHHILVLLLVMLMASVSAWTSGAGGLAHQLEHAFVGAAAADAPHHHHLLQQEQQRHNDPADAGSTAGAEHQMLHAVDHLQFFHGGGVQARLALKTTDADPLRFVVQPLPLASIDPPFRPPRTALLSA